MQSFQHQQYWLGLRLIPDIGAARLARLMAYFDSAEALWLEPDAGLMRLDLPEDLLRHFCRSRRQIDLAREMANVERAGAKLITLEDEAYPRLLRTLSDRPPLLYVRGELTTADEKCLAVVGTRKASAYGRDVAFQLSKQLAQADITIVSGLAHGIDAAAHRGALQASGRTVAVVATGIDRVYPREHGDLAAEIAATGAIISEMPPGGGAARQEFPAAQSHD